MMAAIQALQYGQSAPLVGEATYRGAVDRALEAYANYGAIVITEDIIDPPEDWRRRLLSRHETERLDGFMFDRDRNLYLAAHSLKRMVLGGLCARDPKGLVFRISGAGRPFLMHGGWKGDFNLSHSGHRVALAVVARGRVGVDVQEPSERYSHMLEKLRHPNEADLFAEPSDFMKMWTLKEAVSKAIGTGLGENFETLEVKPTPHSSNLFGCSGWSCRHSVLEDGYHVAVATDNARMSEGPKPLETFVT